MSITKEDDNLPAFAFISKKMFYNFILLLLGLNLWALAVTVCIGILAVRLAKRAPEDVYRKVEQLEAKIDAYHKQDIDKLLCK